jgi:hypothetical protein
MKNILKKDVKKLGDYAEYIAKYNVIDSSWMLEIVAGKIETYNVVVGMLFTERGIIRTFKSLDAISNLLADCGVTKFSTICYKK